MYTKTYSYRSLGNNRTTAQVTNLTYGGFTGALTFTYSYDTMGNISTYTAGGETVTYTYDAQGQLLKAVGDETYTYTYDAAGNVLTASNGTVTHSYTYGNTNWRDLLTAFDGESITYDAIGNPTSYYNGTRWSFSWSNGRQLTSTSNGTNNITYTYTADGMRTSKVVDGVTYNYYYASGKLIRDVRDGISVDYFYDEAGRPYAFEYGGYYYYYITNLQGDVISIIDAWGAEQGSYEYDPYGNILSCTGWAAIFNPLRYRGYYYDTETGLYYLQSRYYDPTTGRFLNADAYASTGQGILGNNMFAYCLNNPASRKEISGMASVDINMTDDPLKDLMDQNEQGGGSGGNSWGSFIRTLQSAADGLSMAMGQKKPSVAENHHVFSNKNKTYTPQYKEIADRYNMLLDAGENIIRLEGHSGRHTNAYHNFMLSALTALNSIANGDPAIFFEGLAIIRGFIRQNPGLPYAKSK